MAELPLDIVFDILSRVPVKSLLRFRCVSEPWCNIIDQPHFASLQITRSSEEPTSLIVSEPTLRKSTLGLHPVKEKEGTFETSENPLVEFDLSMYHATGSCNGLFYFAEYYSEGLIIVSNPLKREVQRLPPAPAKNIDTRLNFFKTYGMGFDNSTKTFKLVCVFFQERTFGPPRYRLGTLVHTLGTGSWREISQVPPYPICSKPVFAHGALHWIVHPYVRYHDTTEGMIVSFDLRKEKFSLPSHPNFHSKDCEFFQLVDLNGNLGMADLSCKSKIEIWVMKDFERKQWVREYRIEICAAEGRFDNRHIEVIGLWKHGDILMRSLLRPSQGYFIYNQKTGLRSTNSSNDLRHRSTISSHRGSLIPLP
ncbi:unnamed protein product [Ilex paraguariensis]|uniref:F-box domain-containing protein n=1 Tax=Ilex paraguariensis TaxID=185542 RepID=A0ABC8SSQ9_9AQUA